MVIDTLGAAGEHDTFWGYGFYSLQGEVVWVDFAIDFLLSDAAGDELGSLGTEVEDQNFFAMDVHGIRGAMVTGGGAPDGLGHPVVGGFFGDDYVVDMAFLKPCRGDANKFSFLAQFFDIASTDIPHSGAQTAQ